MYMIIGSGIAGLVTALRLAQDSQRQITVSHACQKAEECNSYYALGGIVSRSKTIPAKPLIKDDPQSRCRAFLPAGSELLANEGPKLVEDILIKCAQVPFDRDRKGRADLYAGSSPFFNRILHVK